MPYGILIGIIIAFFVLSLCFSKILYEKFQINSSKIEQVNKEFHNSIALNLLTPLYIAWRFGRSLKNKSFKDYAEPIFILVKSNLRIFIYIYILIISFLILTFDTGSLLLNYTAIITLLLFFLLLLDALVSKIHLLLNESVIYQIFIILLIISVGYLYFFGFFSEQLNSQSFSFLMFFTSLYFLIASLILVIRINSLNLRVNVFVIILTAVHAMSIAFFSYILIGYGIAYHDYGADFDGFEVNVHPYDGFNSLISIAYYGITSLTVMPEIIFSRNTVSEDSMIPIEALQLRLVAIAYTTIYTVLILSYFSNILFKRNIKNRTE